MIPSDSPPNPSRERHWLDSSLEEVLGGRRPPDLAARILQALQAAQAQAEVSEPEAPPVAAPALPLATTEPTASTPAAMPVASVAARRSGSRPASAAPTSPAVAAATLAIAGLGAGLLAYLVGRESIPAPASSMARAVPSASSSASVARAGKRAGESAAVGDTAAKAKRTWNAPPSAPVDSTVAGRDQPDSLASRPPETLADPHATGGPVQAAAASDGVESPLDESQLVAWMNGQLRRSWQEAGVASAERATDEEWCRRVFLRLLGRIPTVEEVQAFAADKRPDKREQLVSLVMTEDSKYAAEFANHWAEIWANALVGRKVDSQQPSASREQLVGYLKQELTSNRSFDALAYELISATGSNAPGAADFNGAVNFLLAHVDGKATEATARVSRVFLGRNLQFEPLRAGPDDEGTTAQRQFWQLNAFFRQMQVERLDGGAVRLVNRDFRGESAAARDQAGGEPSDAAVYYELGDGKLRAAYPAFLDGAELPHSGLVSEFDRRQELARRVARSPEFRRSVMNRLWAHFLGFGIVNPLDDLSPRNQASHPELLERLANQFAAHGYDMRRAVRWIVLSESFSLSSKAGAGQVADSPEQGKSPLFSRYYARPMPAEQVYESLRLLAGVRKNGGGNGNSGNANSNAGIAAREMGRRDFLGRVTKRGGLEQPNDFSIIEAVPQSLIKVEGELQQRVFSGEQGSLLEKVAGDKKLKPDEKIERLFQAALARRPTPQESQAARELLKLSPNDPLIGLRDLWWALLNSNEFLFDR